MNPRPRAPGIKSLLVSNRGEIAIRVMRAAAELGIRKSEEHTSELQSQSNLVCRLLLEKKKKPRTRTTACNLSINSYPLLYAIQPINHSTTFRRLHRTSTTRLSIFPSALCSAYSLTPHDTSHHNALCALLKLVTGRCVVDSAFIPAAFLSRFSVRHSLCCFVYLFSLMESTSYPFFFFFFK